MEQGMAGYLFVHFTGEQKDGEQIYFSVSRDGSKQWKTGTVFTYR